MINCDLRTYNYFTLGENNEYGVPTISEEAQGTIKIAINISSQTIQQNINYLNCQYMGITQHANVDDTYIIEYGEERLKVLYVNDRGRYKQVYLEKL